MFAVCLEKNNTDYGKQLLAHALQDVDSCKGLAAIPYEQLIHNQSIQSGLNITLVEQSLFGGLGSEVASSKDQTQFVVGWLRLDNRTEVLAKLGLSENDKCSDRSLILKAYEEWGDTFCIYLVGDFSFAILDLTTQKAYLVRDHFGTRPLYYYQDDNCIFVASSLAVMQAISGLSLTVSERYIVARCMSASADWVKTPYTEVRKVPPASIAKFTLAELKDTPEVNKYHEFDQGLRIKLPAESDYIQRYQTLLSESVKCRVSNINGSLATESSGGIDSSAIAALAAKHTAKFKQKLHAFGYVTCEQEEECINLLSDYVGIEKTQLIKDNETDIDVINKEVDNFSQYAGILPSSYIATTHAPIYKRAEKAEAKVLLSGFGGDEFVTNYSATARVELFKTKQWKAWFTVFKGSFFIRRLRALKWLIRYVWRGNFFETATALSEVANKTLGLSVIKKDKRDQFGVDENIIKNALYDAGCESVNEFSLTNRWSPDMTQRLEDCSLAAASYGIEYRWPLLDMRLVELFFSIPSEYKLRHGLPRYLHRKSIQGLVPEYLIWKDKDMGAAINAPNFENMKENGFVGLESLNIEDFPKEIRNVIDQDKWQNMLNKLKHLECGTAHFSAENQHAMMIMQPVLELAAWLQKNDSNT